MQTSSDDSGSTESSLADSESTPAASILSDSIDLNPVTTGFKVTAVIVTYNPDIGVLRKLLLALEKQLDSIVIVDNGSIKQQDISALGANINYYMLPSNLGLGKAHNLGIEFAKSVQSTHVLLLDQDSLPDQHMLEELSKSVKLLEDNQIKYSGLGCRYVLPADKSQASNFVQISWFRFSRIVCQEKPYVKADFLISSGTLIPIHALDTVGLMDESLFIDHIDTEWFLRASSLGYNAYGCCTAFMNHALGEKTTKIWFGRSRLVPYHRSFRYYYIFRNSFLLYRRHYMSKKWMLADWVRLIQNFIFFGIFASQRTDNLKMMWKGFVDGVSGVSGRRDGLVLKNG